jgi:hypothetical protein
MNCQNIAIALALSIALSHCGSNPVACPCHTLDILSAGNGSRVAGATLRFLITPAPEPRWAWYEISPGEMQANGPFCEAAPFEFEVSHPAYQTQRVRYTPPRALSTNDCTTPRPPTLVVRLQPQ